MDISQNTILWFCSDNGGLKKINPKGKIKPINK